MMLSEASREGGMGRRDNAMIFQFFLTYKITSVSLSNRYLGRSTLKLSPHIKIKKKAAYFAQHQDILISSHHLYFISPLLLVHCSSECKDENDGVLQLLIVYSNWYNNLIKSHQLLLALLKMWKLFWIRSA